MVKMFLAITKDVTKFFAGYAPMGFLLAVIVTAGYLWYEGFWKSKQLNNKCKMQIKHLAGKAGSIFLLTLYVYVVIGITMLSRSEGGTRHASFELFRTFRNTFFSKKQIYENIIMFVPYAMLLFGLSKFFRRARVMLGIGAASSLFIEVTQWVTKTGYFELDDILTNTFGMMIGYGICAFCERIRERKSHAGK